MLDQWKRPGAFHVLCNVQQLWQPGVTMPWVLLARSAFVGKGLGWAHRQKLCKPLLAMPLPHSHSLGTLSSKDFRSP